ncbi:MAG: hypothetical protein RIS29_170, partial [Bacteroidota bacterium]
MKFITTSFLAFFLLIINNSILAATGTWSSSATGGTINYTVTE